MKRAALYVRVSTDRQTVENQIARLTEIARGRGWQIVQTFSDAGISGAKGRNERPGFDQMLKHATAPLRCGHGLGYRSNRALPD
jgi:DNA invertase Pin-like site-specific DNA recombinase